MFDREPDQSGYDYWMGHLNKGVSREYVFRGFAEGVEFEALCRSSTRAATTTGWVI